MPHVPNFWDSWNQAAPDNHDRYYCYDGKVFDELNDEVIYEAETDYEAFLYCEEKNRRNC
jgi:hypothetical protein